MNRSDSKYFSTAKRMDSALMELLAAKEFPYITVKEICRVAGVNRSTFYLHYETMSDLLKECIASVFDDLYMRMGEESKKLMETLRTPEVRNVPLERMVFITPDYLIPYLEFVKANRPLFGAALLQPEIIGVEKILNSLFQNVFDPILDRFHYDDKERRFVMAYYLHGMSAIIFEWLRGGCREEESYIAGIMARCVIPIGNGLFSPDELQKLTGGREN